MPQFRRGRRRGVRWISKLPAARVFGPLDRPPLGTIQLTMEEMEAIRLVDLEGLDQESAAAQMGISRKSLWVDLKSARRKVARALVHGMVIQIRGGSYIFRDDLEEGFE